MNRLFLGEVSGPMGLGQEVRVMMARGPRIRVYPTGGSFGAILLGRSLGVKASAGEVFSIRGQGSLEVKG